MLDDKLVTVPLQLGVDKIPELRDVPHVLDLTDDPKQKAALRLIFSRQAMARPFARRSRSAARACQGAARRVRRDDEGPGVPRRYGAPETRSAAGPGAELDELVRELYSYPADVVKIAADRSSRRRGNRAWVP